MTSKLLNKFPIPENFPDILHDFAKEVVREQPKDLLDFAVEYFKAMKNGTTLDYGHKHEKHNSIDTNDVATNPATKTIFDIRREDKPKEEINNNSIEEKEGQQSQSGSHSNNSESKSEGKVKESMNVVSKSQNSLLYSERKPDESDNNQMIKSDEQQAKDFIEDVLRTSQEEVQHIIQGLKQKED